MTDTGNSATDSQKAYIVVGIVAATVSAAVAAYVITTRLRQLNPHADTVQELLDRCHSQVREIEQRLADLHPAVQQSTSAASR